MADTRETYLVFEAQPAAGTHAIESMGAVHRYTPPVVAYGCVGAVKARDPQEAAMAIARGTRRIGKYAIVSATIVDLNYSEPDDTGEELPQLNP
jgi:hypothetical protein